MKEKQVAKVYAQAFMEMGIDKKVDITAEVIKFTEIINSSNDLENLLFLDIFTVEEKKDVFNSIGAKAGLSLLTVDLITYLISERRINIFPLIFKEMVVIDDHNKGFLRGTIEGSQDSIDDDMKQKLTQLIKEKIGKTPTLKYVKKDDISAGFRVTVEDLQLDASLDNQLKQFKDSILN